MWADILDETRALKMSKEHNFKDKLRTLIELSYTYSHKVSENVNGEII
jgi:hypothetical protein